MKQFKIDFKGYLNNSTNRQVYKCSSSVFDKILSIYRGTNFHNLQI